MVLVGQARYARMYLVCRQAWQAIFMCQRRGSVRVGTAVMIRNGMELIVYRSDGLAPVVAPQQHMKWSGWWSSGIE